MIRLRTPLLIAGIALGVAATNAAHPIQPPTTPERPAARPTTTPKPTSPTTSHREPLRLARAYALAATNWTARTRMAAWQRELVLAAPEYARALGAARPTRTRLRALRTERARSRATVVRADIDPQVRLPRVRVLVALRERTSSVAGTLAGQTRNEVLLEHSGGRWRVTGWSVLPGGSTR
jgi:hypothetical protein